MSPDASSSPVDDGAAARRAEAAAIRDGNLAAAFWMAGSGLAATVMSVAIKAVSDQIESPMLAFLRSALGLWVLAPMLLDGSLKRMRFSRPWLHVLRGVLMGLALNFGFYAIAELPLTTATILFFLAPVFATMLAGPVLGQSVGLERWLAAFAGFAGAAIILRPGFGPFDWAMASAIASSACFAVSLTLSRILGRADGPRSVLLSSTAVAALVCVPIAAPVWTLPADLGAWTWIAVLVLSSSARMYADIQAYAKGESAFVAPFAYLRLLFVAIAGYLLFDQLPDEYDLIGGVVIMAATLYIAHRERRPAAGPPL